MADDQDRNLPASERKIRKAREDGQVARSRDLGHLAVVGGGGAALALFAPRLTDAMTTLMAGALRFDAALLAEPDAMQGRLLAVTLVLVPILLVLGAIATTLAIGANLAAGGWNFTWKPLMPNFGKLDPISGLGRMVSGAHLGELIKACVLALVLAVIGGSWLWWHLAQFHDALTMPLPVALAHTGRALLQGLGLLVLALAVFAAIDLPLQRMKLMKQLRMSHQEAKQEHKEAEGNAEVKGRIKARMREMARKRMLAAVPKADLVVMNPTHYAVALKYDAAAMGAPRVVAKGADLLAFRIKDIAQEHRVPVLQAPPLARALYAHCQIDQEIPARLFTAVARVLAHVMQLKAALAGHGRDPGALPPLEVPADMDPADPASSPEARAAAAAAATGEGAGEGAGEDGGAAGEPGGPRAG
ncbi:MAG: type secretion protein [Pseudomonadota bacterium]